MVLTATAENRAATGRPRPLDPARDLGAVADLIGEAFSEEIDRQGRAAIREMRWMARMSPLVWWWAQADPSFRESYNGFVWEELPPGGHGRPAVVGNVNLNRAPGSQQRWVICNVVVHPLYRRQGIARQLMAASLAEARILGADGVVLQVYRDNEPALRLYSELGFQQTAGETELRAERAVPVAMPDAAGYRIEPWRPDHGKAAYELALAAIPTTQQWLRPVRPGDYQPDWLIRWSQGVEELLAGRRTWRLLALTEGDAGLAGLLTVNASFRRGSHRLSLLVHPRHRGRLEAALISRALYMLAGVPARPVTATINAEHSAALKVLGEYGFREQRTLLTMSLNVRREREPSYG